MHSPVRLTEKELEQAACKGEPEDLWFPVIIDDDGTEWLDDGQIYEAFGDTAPYYTAARAICEECPIRERCLEVAMNRKERYGMWGGQNPLERRRVERRERRARRQEKLKEDAIKATIESNG